jgi:hypothetical protein
MTCVGLVQHLEGEAMKRSVLKPGFEGSADRDFTEALVQKQFRVAEFDVSLIAPCRTRIGICTSPIARSERNRSNINQFTGKIG